MTNMTLKGHFCFLEMAHIQIVRSLQYEENTDLERDNKEKIT